MKVFVADIMVLPYSLIYGKTLMEELVDVDIVGHKRFGEHKCD